MKMARSDQVGLLDVVEEELILPVGVAKTVVPLGCLGDRRHLLSEHTQQARLPERDVVPEHLRLHLCELPGIGQHACSKIHECPGDSEFVASGDALAPGPTLQKLLHDAAGALRHFGEHSRALGGIGWGLRRGHVC